MGRRWALRLQLGLKTHLALLGSHLMGRIEMDISPEKPLGVCPFVSSTSDGKHAWCGRMWSWSTACTLELSDSQKGGGRRGVLKAMQLRTEEQDRGGAGTEASSSKTQPRCPTTAPPPLCSSPAVASLCCPGPPCLGLGPKDAPC